MYHLNAWKSVCRFARNSGYSSVVNFRLRPFGRTDADFNVLVDFSSDSDSLVISSSSESAFDEELKEGKISKFKVHGKN